MSLSVHVYLRDAEDNLTFLDDEAGYELAGFESSRKRLWGSPAARSLGLTLVPTLVQEDLYIEGSDVKRLEREIRLVLENVALLACASEYDEAYVRARASNILRATIRAQEQNAGVVIW